MEANQIKKLFEAMSVNGFSSLELTLGKSNRVRLRLEDLDSQAVSDSCIAGQNDAEETIPRTQVEIRSDKVGIFSFDERSFTAGDVLRKGETLGTIRGISFQDKVKCSLDGTIASVLVESGDVVDYGRLLFVVNID